MNAQEKMIYRLRESIKAALILKNESGKIVARQMLSGLENAAIAKRRDLTEVEVIEVISREVKQYREAYEAAEKSGRVDLCTKAYVEMETAKLYLPPQLEEYSVREMITEIIDTEDATDMPSIMKSLMPRIKGQFDGKRAKELVEEAIPLC